MLLSNNNNLKKKKFINKIKTGGGKPSSESCFVLLSVLELCAEEQNPFCYASGLQKHSWSWLGFFSSKNLLQVLLENGFDFLEFPSHGLIEYLLLRTSKCMLTFWWHHSCGMMSSFLYADLTSDCFLCFSSSACLF